MDPSRLFCLSHLAVGGQRIIRSFDLLKFRVEASEHPNARLYLDVKTLDIIIANQFVTLIGIGYFLGTPGLGGSIIQEGANLQEIQSKR